VVMERAHELELIQRAKRGDAAALGALIDGHRDSLHHFLLRLTRREDVAEDIGQEAFVRVLRNLDRFDERFRFSTWIFTIARRLWINHIQKFRPIPDSDAVGSRPGQDDGPEVVAETKEHKARIADAVAVGLAALNPRQREIVELFHGRELSIQEIAFRLELPVGTIKSHLFRARRRMSAAVLEEGRFDPVGSDDERSDEGHPVPEVALDRVEAGGRP
jgi:RNA polymerase sigma-70 factor (ECF subfamily)